MQVDKARLEEMIMLLSRQGDGVRQHGGAPTAEDELVSALTELLELRSLRSTEGKEGEPVAWQRRLMNPVDDVNGHKAGVWGGWKECSADQAKYAKETGGVEGFKLLRAQVRPLYAIAEAAEAHVAKLRAALEEMRMRDDRNGSLPPAYREIIDGALSGAALTRSPE